MKFMFVLVIFISLFLFGCPNPEIAKPTVTIKAGVSLGPVELSVLQPINLNYSDSSLVSNKYFEEDVIPYKLLIQSPNAYENARIIIEYYEQDFSDILINTPITGWNQQINRTSIEKTDGKVIHKEYIFGKDGNLPQGTQELYMALKSRKLGGNKKNAEIGIKMWLADEKGNKISMGDDEKSITLNKREQILNNTSAER